MAKICQENFFTNQTRKQKGEELVEEYNATSFLTESASEITVQMALNPDELMLLADTTNMATGVKHDYCSCIPP